MNCLGSSGGNFPKYQEMVSNLGTVCLIDGSISTVEEGTPPPLAIRYNRHLVHAFHWTVEQATRLDSSPSVTLSGTHD